MNLWDDVPGKRWGKFELDTDEWRGPFCILKHEQIKVPAWASKAVKANLESVAAEENRRKADVVQWRQQAKGSGPNAVIAQRQLEGWEGDRRLDRTGRRDGAKSMLEKLRKAMACRLWLHEGAPEPHDKAPVDRPCFILDYVYVDNTGEFYVPAGIETPKGMYQELEKPYRFMHVSQTVSRLLTYTIRKLSVREKARLLREVFPDSFTGSADTGSVEGVGVRKQARERFPVVSPNSRRYARLTWNAYCSSANGQHSFRDCWDINEEKMKASNIESAKHLRAVVRAGREEAKRKEARRKRDEAKASARA